MSSNEKNFHEAFELIEQIIQMQQKTLLEYGQEIVPNLTTDDILQPNDFLELETNPHFRYEEGVLAGIQTVNMALQALLHDKEYT